MLHDMIHDNPHPQISSVVGDFPLVHPAMYGKPTRYAYTAVTDTKDEAAQVKVRPAPPNTADACGAAVQRMQPQHGVVYWRYTSQGDVSARSSLLTGISTPCSVRDAVVALVRLAAAGHCQV